MNAEELAIARRFAACPKWVWLQGMRAVQPVKTRVADFARLTCCVAGNSFMTDRRLDEGQVWVFDGLQQCRGDFPWVPDLDDELTRLGVLAVVRRALGMPSLAAVLGDDGWYLFGVPSNRPELLWSTASEIEALCFALEAAR